MRTLGTPPLTPPQIWAEIYAFAALCQAQGILQVEVEYGWGCRPPAAGKFAAVAVSELVAWIADAAAGGHYSLGEDNLHLRIPALPLEFLLCHDGDVHIMTDNTAWLEALRARWQGQGYSVWGK